MPTRIITRWGLPPDVRARVGQAGPGVTIESIHDKAKWREALATTDAIFGAFDPADLPHAPNLRWVHYGSAGVDAIMTPAVVDGPVVLTSSRGCYAPAIAEHAIGLMLGLSRGIGEQARHMAAGTWRASRGAIELAGAIMGIVGYGGIGRAVAKLAKGFDMRVIGADATPCSPPDRGPADEVWQIAGRLDELLAIADVVVCAAPLTSQTRRMFAGPQFARMKPSAYVVNVSRGELVDTPALVAALQQSQIAGAGLDVVDLEPLPPDHPLWAMPNVLLTAHMAGQSPRSGTRVFDVFVENVRRFTRGEPLLNVVDKRAAV